MNLQSWKPSNEPRAQSDWHELWCSKYNKLDAVENSSEMAERIPLSIAILSQIQMGGAIKEIPSVVKVLLVGGENPVINNNKETTKLIYE